MVKCGDPICNTMARLGSKEVAAFRNRMAADGFARATIIRTLNILATIINHARRNYGIVIQKSGCHAMESADPHSPCNDEDRSRTR
jgi:hypothetical protein